MLKSVLFLMGVGLDTPTLVAIAFLFFFLGLLIFLIVRRIIRRFLNVRSGSAITLLSVVISFFVTPILMACALITIMFITVEATTPVEPVSADRIRAQYRVMEKDLDKNLQIGMSRKDVVEIFGYADTTSTDMIYDLSLPEADEKFILQLKFEDGFLTSYQRSKDK